RSFALGGRIGHFFDVDEDAALELLGAAGTRRLLLSQDFFREVLRVVLRPVAQARRVRVVVPAARIARNTVDDLEPDPRVIDADRHELRDVARADPDREAALVDRR